jgi:hypothetical protein
MKKLLTLALVLVALTAFAGVGVAQQNDKQKSLPKGIETKQPAAGEKKLHKGATPQLTKVNPPAQTGYGVAINNPESNTDLVKNPSQKPIIVIASCNATSAPKDLEGWVGQNDPATVQDMVASLSGNGRQTITFVVPWGWHYYIRVSEQPIGGGIPPGGICKATAWWTN